MNSNLDALVEVGVPIVDVQLLQSLVVRKDLYERLAQFLGARAPLPLVQLGIVNFLLQVAVLNADLKDLQIGIRLKGLNCEQELVK